MVNSSILLPLSAQLSDTVHAIEVEWKAASADGVSNGLLRLWVDGTLIVSVPVI